MCCNSPSHLRVGTLDERRGNSRHGVNRVYPSSIVILSFVSAALHLDPPPASLPLSLSPLRVALRLSLFVVAREQPPSTRKDERVVLFILLQAVSWTTFLALACRTFGQLATKRKNSCLYIRIRTWTTFASSRFTLHLLERFLVFEFRREALKIRIIIFGNWVELIRYTHELRRSCPFLSLFYVFRQFKRVRISYTRS